MKKALILSLSLNIIIAGIFAAKRIYYHQHPSPAKAPSTFFDDWNKMRVSLYESQSIDTNDVVFVGTSLTEAFPVTEIYGAKYKNRGIGGNTTIHIANRIGGITRARPKKIFIEAGTNDLIAGYPIQAIFNVYAKIIDSIKRGSPASLLYVQSTLPMRGVNAYLNDSVTVLDRRLKVYCKDHGVPYIDLYSHMVASGNMLDSTLTADGIHLNGKGYEIWQEAISRYVH